MASFSMTRRQFLVMILVLLLILLGLLVYLYLTLVKPVGWIFGPPKIAGIANVRSIYGFGQKEKDQLNSPTSVAVDTKHRIFVADTQNRRVLMFDLGGNYLGQVAGSGKDKGVIEHPEGVNVGPNDDIYVCDTEKHEVLIFSSRLRLKKEIKEMYPFAVYTRGERIYVVTFSHISVYSKNYRLVDRWGRRGKKVGQFDFPHGIAVLDNGTVIVSDGNNMRLQALLNSKGDAAWVVGKPPKGMEDPNREFGLPAGLTLDEDENIYVADPLRSSIHVFNSKGKRLAEVGEIGTRDGQLSYPSDIAYAGGNTFVIADTLNNRVQIVRIEFSREKQMQ